MRPPAARTFARMTQTKQPQNWPYLLLSVLLLGAAAYVIWRINNPPVRTDPWETYLAIPGAFPPAGGEPLRDVIVDFNAGDYEAVTQKAPLLLAADSITDRAATLYLLGVSYLKTREAYPAIYQLEKIPPDHPLSASANYYRAVAYYLTGNRRKAKLLLADIAMDARHPEYDRARTLLDELD